MCIKISELKPCGEEVFKYGKYFRLLIDKDDEKTVVKFKLNKKREYNTLSENIKFKGLLDNSTEEVSVSATNMNEFCMLCSLFAIEKNEKVYADIAKITTCNNSSDEKWCFLDKNDKTEPKKWVYCAVESRGLYTRLNALKDILGDYFVKFDVDNKKKEEKKVKKPNNQNKDNDMETIKTAIENGSKQIILTGAPGSGKTRMAKMIADEIWKKEHKEESKDEQCPCYELVQFHPSYDYTDFVEGLRPIAEKGDIKFKKIDGIFKRFCRFVVEQKTPDKKFFFIIDEINRADLSKVFGELMYCLESDKRGEKNKIQTQYQNLPTSYIGEEEHDSDVFKDGFYIPENVIIIGTMNDIDRSVESMDFALRRRFEWREIKVTKQSLQGAFEDMCTNDWNVAQAEAVAENLAGKVEELNQFISSKTEYGLNRQYYISQGQFAGLSNSITEILSKEKLSEEKLLEHVNEFLDAVFKWRIELLLREYLRGEDEKEIETFIKACKEALGIEEDNKVNTD